MICLFHKHNKVVEIHDSHGLKKTYDESHSVALVLLDLAKSFPDELIIWCHHDLKPYLNDERFQEIFHHKRIMASFDPNSQCYLPDQIGYVDQSFFLKVNKSVQFPTWKMSSMVGGIHASVLNLVSKNVSKHSNFDYFLNSISKLSMQEGLFCYSNPELLKINPDTIQFQETASIETLFQFVKQHYKWVWVFFLTCSIMIFEKRFVFIPLIRSLFFNRLKVDFDLESIKINSSKRVVEKGTIDVIIPTIGRKQFLYDVLKDLSNQSYLPNQVIIVEQNPDIESHSELDFLTTETWPFKIVHVFTHQIGVCNARNIALSKVKSEWTLLGDDDNRLESDVIEKLFRAIKTTGVKVGSTVYIQPHEKQAYLKTAQTSIFGAGNSIVKTDLTKKVAFDDRYEFNYGEDSDFGMQLRNMGEDVVFFSNIKITHLKAPVGGYRLKVHQPWDKEVVKPKPSPTIYLLKSTYATPKQLMGYKLLLALRVLKTNGLVNPFRFIKKFNEQWEKSAFWSKRLKNTLNA